MKCRNLISAVVALSLSFLQACETQVTSSLVVKKNIEKAEAKGVSIGTSLDTDFEPYSLSSVQVGESVYLTWNEYDEATDASHIRVAWIDAAQMKYLDLTQNLDQLYAADTGQASEPQLLVVGNELHINWLEWVPTNNGNNTNRQLKFAKSSIEAAAPQWQSYSPPLAASGFEHYNGGASWTHHDGITYMAFNYNGVGKFFSWANGAWQDRFMNTFAVVGNLSSYFFNNEPHFQMNSTALDGCGLDDTAIEDNGGAHIQSWPALSASASFNSRVFKVGNELFSTHLEYPRANLNASCNRSVNSAIQLKLSKIVNNAGRASPEAKANFPVSLPTTLFSQSDSYAVSPSASGLSVVTTIEENRIVVYDYSVLSNQWQSIAILDSSGQEINPTSEYGPQIFNIESKKLLIWPTTSGLELRKF